MQVAVSLSVGLARCWDRYCDEDGENALIWADQTGRHRLLDTPCELVSETQP